MTLDEPGQNAHPCPNCGAALEEGQVVCLECGYHTGLGRCVDATPKVAADKPAAVPLASRIAPLLEWAARRRVLVIGVAAGALVLVALVFALSRGGREDEVAEVGGPTETEHVPLSIPQGRNLSSEEREEACRRLDGADLDTVVGELARMRERDRTDIAAILAERPLREGRITTIRQLRDHLALAAKILPDRRNGAFENYVTALVGKPEGPLCSANLDPEGVSLLAACSDHLRPRLASAIMRDAAANGLPLDSFLAWWNPLMEASARAVTGIQGRGRARARPVAPAEPITFTRDTLERILPSLVLLRAGDLRCLGAVVAVRDDEVLVALAVSGFKAPGSGMDLAWEAAAGDGGGEEWVGALRTGPVVGRPLPRPQTFVRLLAFPPTGSLARAVPASFAAGDLRLTVRYRLFAPVLPNGAVPRPDQWRIAMPQQSVKLPEMIGCVFLTPAGELGGVSAAASGAFVGEPFAGLSRPRLVQRDFEADPAGRAAMRIVYDLWDPDGQAAGATALVLPGCRKAECDKAASNYRSDQAKPAFESPSEVPLAQNGSTMVLALKPPFADDGTAVLVQPCLNLTTDEKVYLPPQALYVSGNRSPATGDWLVDGEISRFLEARDKGAAMVLSHTVDGAHLRYGCLDIVELFLQPSAIVLGAPGDHLYVADSVGIRRVAVNGFRETSGLALKEGKAVALAGSSQGLVVVVDNKESASVEVLDPETLAQQSSLPAGSVPEFLAGNWRNSRVVSVSKTGLSVVDLASRKLVQRLDMAALNRFLFGNRPAPRKLVLGVEFAADGQSLYLLSDAAIHCLRVTAEGLAKAGEDGILCKLAIPQQEPTPLVVGPDGDYAIVGMVVYDLRRTPVQAGPLLFSRPMFIHVPTGRMIGQSTTHQSFGIFQLLDHRGVETLSWPAKPSPIVCRAAIHPDGRHCLLWSGTEALWVAVGPEEAAE